MKKGLLIIDPQFDFCHPNGKLSVKGAHDDMCRLSEWINNKVDSLDSIAITLDSHQPNDVSHPGFWKDINGNSPNPFTQITHIDVVSGKWIPKFNPEVVTVYLKLLEEQGEYPHVIWLEHCLIGSSGASIYEPILSAVCKWALYKNAWYKTFIKGEMPLIEHFGALRPQVSMESIGKIGNFNTIDWINTQKLEWTSKSTGQDVIDWCSAQDIIYIAGEAKSHCVVSTIKQMVEIIPDQISKLIILEDCMSDVEGFKNLGEPIFLKVKEMGARFENSVMSIRESVVA